MIRLRRFADAQGIARVKLNLCCSTYVFAFDGVRAVKDVEFISGDLTIKYSDFFSEDLMEASETLDTADLFN